LQQDVINLVLGSLPNNISQSVLQLCPGDLLLNHSLINCYLGTGNSAVREARSKVVTSVTNEIDGALPAQTTRLGNIVATLTWQTPADVDLHGYEPNGGPHVYYAARQGTTAQLDRDDTSGTGPENIFVCGDPTVGAYQFGVNYFSGTRAQTATVALHGGSLTRSFTIPLTSGVGTTGNNPAPFGQVIVTHDGQGFHYDIR
jgi:hypothetical protein